MRRALGAVAAMVALVACGDDPHEFAGYQMDPAPVVAGVTLPDVANGAQAFPMRAEPGELLLVYFGYTNCPDACPTTLTDTGIAEREIDLDSPGSAERIDMAMVTVDPARDLPTLADYVTSFHADGHALGTDDPAALAEAAQAFGVTYVVEGEAVSHSDHLYAVDETGTVVMTWTWPTELDALTADLVELLERA